MNLFVCKNIVSLSVCFSILMWGASAKASPKKNATKGPLPRAHLANKLLQKSLLFHTTHPVTNKATSQPIRKQQVKRPRQAFATRVKCSGSLFYEGHYAKPGLRKRYGADFSVVWSSKKAMLSFKEQFRSLHSSWKQERRLFSLSGKWFHLAPRSKSFVPLSSQAVTNWRTKITIRVPQLFLSHILRSPKRSLWLYTQTSQNPGARAFQVIQYTTANGQSLFLFLDSKSHRLEKVQSFVYDAFRGDGVQTFEYVYPAKTSRFPVKVRKRLGKTLVMDWRCTRPSFKVELVAPSAIRPKKQKKALPFLSRHRVGHQLYVLELLQMNHRVMLAEFQNFVVVLEAPRSYAVGRRIVQQVKRWFPTKPIKYIIVTHHHPDHAGAVRAFTEEGSRLVTTPGNRNLFEKMHKSQHVFSTTGERKNTSSSKARFLPPVFVRKKWMLQDKTQALVLYDIGKRSHHTDEHLIVHFPKQEILFEGDLVNFRRKSIRPINLRGLGVYRSILSHKLKVKFIVQSWPLRYTPRLAPFSLMEKMVKMRKKAKKRK